MGKKDIFEKKEVEKKLHREALHDVKLSEMLNTEKAGFIETEPGVKTSEITQKEILKNVSQRVKEMCFNLDIEGPAYVRYTSNGRHLAIRNDSGFISSIDTHNMKLHFEDDFKERIYDMSYLHTEDYIAVAQENCLFVYNKQGVELHAVRANSKARKLEFLPYHFLLVSACADGKLKYLDTTNGEIVSKIYIKDKEVTCLKQNKRTAIVYTGHRNGVVSLWSPNSEDYLARILTHKNMVSSIEIDRTGTYLYTTGVDSTVNVWDIRNTYSPVNSTKIYSSASCTSLSQYGLLAVGSKNKVRIYKDLEKVNSSDNLYLQHKEVGSKITSLAFRDYEDILTVGHLSGIVNIVVPGSGDPTYDSYEDCPFDTKDQKKEKEIKRLLDKIPYQLITLEQKLVTDDEKKPPESNQQESNPQQSKSEVGSALDRFKEA
ncbi:WD repeat-containing protein 46 [Nosema granulosis]|uniref:U three protein 7 n=1 Tax=Nosema granulosis TaxID=83296 RepID=A0A9P6GXY1_9MICR|nr:WD repeat-containing protein 46 [Nosema granulosis]